MNLRQALTAATARLAAEPHLRENAARDAEILLLRALAMPRTALYSDADRLLSPEEAARFDAWIARRLALEPIQYILGEQEFYGLAFHVTPATLIPRSETELLVEAVLQRLPCQVSLDIADVGTGSGAIAVSLAVHLPLARILALDLSPEALEVAQENASRHAVGSRIHFQLSDLLGAIAPNTRFHAIVSNPPYVPESDRQTLHPQVRNHEPPLALFAGSDGLAIYRRLIPQAASALYPGGLLAMEIGFAQANPVTPLLHHWQEVEVLNDLNRIPRVILARRP